MCAKTYSIQVTQNLPGAAGSSVAGTFGKLVGETIFSKSSSSPSCSNSSSSFKSSSWANKMRIKLFRTEIAILSAHHRPTIIIIEFFILDIRLISRQKLVKELKNNNDDVCLSTWQRFTTMWQFVLTLETLSKQWRENQILSRILPTAPEIWALFFGNLSQIYDLCPTELLDDQGLCNRVLMLKIMVKFSMRHTWSMNLFQYSYTVWYCFKSLSQGPSKVVITTTYQTWPQGTKN